MKSTIVLFVLLWALPSFGQPLRECLAVPGVVVSGRYAIVRDPVHAQIARSEWRPPREGETLRLPDGSTRTWRRLTANSEGVFVERSAYGGGYASFELPSDTERPAILAASGHSMIYVNGEPRTGNPYGYEYARLPIRLRKGVNHLLAVAGRGPLTVNVEPCPDAAWITERDATLPDLLRGERVDAWLGVLVTNATQSTLRGLRILARGEGLRSTTTSVPPLGPSSLRKVAVRIQGPAPTGTQAEAVVTLTLQGAGAQPAPVTLRLRIRERGTTYKRTFLSEIDGSVQYYAVNPAWPRRGGAKRDADGQALVLSLHGAGVEALGQAEAYASKSWAHIVCPTNRRPFGFDWEEWGRLDALEALRHARSELRTDPMRTYLTGHSMGGHGTWQIGLHYPDLFAAVAPSAGWISFQTYGGGMRIANPSPVEQMLLRAGASSDTLSLLQNARQQAVYVLHGDADDNVPISEARAMVSALRAFHTDLSVHEQPGAGHWWESSDEPGAECVDWPGFFDLFARRRLPAMEAVRSLDFTTANPEVSARCHWLTVLSQERPLLPSSARLSLDPHRRRITGETANIARLRLDLRPIAPGGEISVALDGDRLEGLSPHTDGALYLERIEGRWKAATPPPATEKSPERHGPFKNAFQHRFLLVYGTQGTPEENAWAYARARYDAETFWYRGNGSPDIVQDKEFNVRMTAGRSVILYGNSETNGAWRLLLDGSPVEVRRGGARIGGRTLEGPDIALFFVRPRPNDAKAYVAVVSGTGIAGMRATDRVPVFLSGTAIPDCLALGVDSYERGAAGVRAAGFFGRDWSVERGEFAWQPAPGP